MRKTYLVNAFSINMIKTSEFPIAITIGKIDQEMFCTYLITNLQNGVLVNAIGHDSTINLVNRLCGTQLQKNRIEVKLDIGDIALVIMINQRLEEGKVLNEEEIMRMLSEGKISFYEVLL